MLRFIIGFIANGSFDNRYKRLLNVQIVKLNSFASVVDDRTFQ